MSCKERPGCLGKLGECVLVHTSFYLHRSELPGTPWQCKLQAVFMYHIHADLNLDPQASRF